MKFYVYISTNPNRDALYVGMTNNLEQSIIEHFRKGQRRNPCRRILLLQMVSFEEHKYVNVAIAREKEIKKWRRKKKETLIGLF
jgi:putative endonuclease